eukprot:gene2617-2918_t
MNSSAVITGAASGIGRVLVKTLAQQGFNLTREELQQQLPTVDVLVVAADVCSNAAMGRAFREHQSRYGGVDLVVLNAGIGERGDFLDTSNVTEALEKTLDVDLRAVITGARLAAQAMIAGQQGGRIISIASAAGIFPMTAGPYYAAAKAGVIHFTRSLAPRLTPHSISLSTICPQYVDTPLVQKILRDQPEVAKAMMGPLYGQQLLQPQQVVDVIQGLIDAPLPAKGKKGLAPGLPSGHVLIRRLFVGINASDVNYTSGR